jgi:Ca-activated chloride channel family protein
MSMWLRSPRLRRAIALSSIVLATGGLVLYKAPASANQPPITRIPLTADGKNSVAFSGPGLRGTLSLSHTKVLAGGATPMYAELRLAADDTRDRAAIRAPISLAVVLDTSGSMSGEKIQEGKRSVLRLLADMRDDDEIAVIRYSDTSEMIQPLARVGTVRAALARKISELGAGGGTNIPGGLSHGLRSLDEAAKGRVRRIVLVSDGLDGTRAQSEALARTSFGHGITVSSLGIGLDFDESYMGSVAQNGHGNFAFVKDGASLAGFLKRELEETALTTIENARVRVRLPQNVRFVSALGADARVTSASGGDELELSMGSLFAGDERRVIVELVANTYATVAPADFDATATWNQVGGATATVTVPRLTVLAVNDASEVEKGRDGAVLANATSAIVSKRQIEATAAYTAGDISRATQLTADNERALADAMVAAPAPLATSLAEQKRGYGELKKTFGFAKPGSAEGQAAAKSAVSRELGNTSRKGY